MTHTYEIGVKKPYFGNHKILQLVGSLEYANGSSADLDTGVSYCPNVNDNYSRLIHQPKLWFHHLVLLNTGRDVRTPLCRNSTIEIIYTNGNEKSIGYFGLNNSTVKSGYPVSDADKFVLNTQLMNMDDKEKYVWVTLTYDYIPDPQGLKEARLHWMTLGGLAPAYCVGVAKNPWGVENVTSDLIPLSDAFEENSIPMPYPMDGLFYGASAHVHDGGIGVEIYRNSEMVCNSLPTYGKTNGGHSHSGDSGEHIIKQSGCQYLDPLPVQRGDNFWMKVKYDFNQHPG
jgi:hypothetical protein